MKKQILNIPFAMLNLATVVQNSTPKHAFHNSLKRRSRESKIDTAATGWQNDYL